MSIVSTYPLAVLDCLTLAASAYIAGRGGCLFFEAASTEADGLVSCQIGLSVIDDTALGTRLDSEHFYMSSFHLPLSVSKVLSECFELYLFVSPHQHTR